jgi:hypothetical protein
MCWSAALSAAGWVPARAPCADLVNVLARLWARGASGPARMRPGQKRAHRGSGELD